MTPSSRKNGWTAVTSRSAGRSAASRRAYMATTRACLGIWLVLTVLGMVFEIGMLPVTVLLLVWGLMQVTYTLECIRLSKNGMAAQ